jgi:hypothetical protein
MHITGETPVTSHMLTNTTIDTNGAKLVPVRKMRQQKLGLSSH